MKTTNIFLLLIIISFFSFGQKSIKKSIKDYELEIQKIIVSEKFEETEFKILGKLINNTSDTLFYFSMSCSWQEFYFTDKENIKVKTSPCDKNVQTVVALAPNSNRLLELEFVYKKKVNQNNSIFKIGFDLVKAKNRFDRQNFDKLNRTSKTIWSENIIYNRKASR